MADLHSRRDELDTIERKLVPVRERFVDVWRSIERSRHGVIPLDRETYVQRKIEFGNLESAIRCLEDERHLAESGYDLALFRKWLNELDENRPTRVTLKQLWQLWRNVLAAREAVADLPDRVPEYQYMFGDTDLDNARHAAAALAEKTTGRQWADVNSARERAEFTYDIALRVFEGREPWDWEKHGNDGWRLRAPKRPEPTPMQRMQWKQKQRRSKRSAFAEPYRKVVS